MITRNYALEYRLKGNHKYQWTKCGKLFNVKSERELKQVYVSRCLGYYIDGKFKSLTYLRKELERIPKKEYTPF